MNNIRQLKDRYFDKYLSLYKLKSKADLINHIFNALNNNLPEDINEVTRFTLNIDNSKCPLTDSNCDFYIEYKGLETVEEYRDRVKQEQINIHKKMDLLVKLASELDYKLVKDE